MKDYKYYIVNDEYDRVVYTYNNTILAHYTTYNQKPKEITIYKRCYKTINDCKHYVKLVEYNNIEKYYDMYNSDIKKFLKSYNIKQNNIHDLYNNKSTRKWFCCC